MILTGPYLYLILGATDGDSGWPSLVKSANPITLAIVGLAALPMIIILIKWTLKLQKEFMVYYIEENTKLRKRQDELETEGQKKDETIRSLEQEVQTLKLMATRHEFTIEGQRLRAKQQEKSLEHCEETIERLNGIIERRGLTRDD